MRATVQEVLREELSILTSLGMAEDDTALIGRILLRTGGSRSSVKRLMPVEADNKAEDQYEQTEGDRLGDLTVGDDLTGIGVLKQSAEVEDIDRQSQNINEALRKKLMSKEAYSRLNSTKNPSLAVANPMSKQARDEMDSDSERERKGKSNKQKQYREISASGMKEAVTAGSTTASIKSKKRAGSYLDQLLAERNMKKRKG